MDTQPPGSTITHSWAIQASRMGDHSNMIMLAHSHLVLDLDLRTEYPTCLALQGQESISVCLVNMQTHLGSHLCWRHLSIGILRAF